MKLSIFGCSFKCRNEIGRTLVQQVVQSMTDLVVRDEHGRAVLEAGLSLDFCGQCASPLSGRYAGSISAPENKMWEQNRRSFWIQFSGPLALVFVAGQ